jgi:transcriptional antiterminator RfaH
MTDLNTTSNDLNTGKPSWYAVYTKPREEDRAESNLRAFGLKTLMPKIKEQRSREFNSKTKVKHLFPRYIFAHFNCDISLHKVNYTRGVCGVVRFGDKPCPIDDIIIETIQSQIGQEGFIKFEETFCNGDHVMIKDGPFKSLHGTVEREMSDSDRLVVLLSSLSYQGRLMIEKALVRKIATNN